MEHVVDQQKPWLAEPLAGLRVHHPEEPLSFGPLAVSDRCFGRSNKPLVAKRPATGQISSPLQRSNLCTGQIPNSLLRGELNKLLRHRLVGADN